MKPVTTQGFTLHQEQKKRNTIECYVPVPSLSEQGSINVCFPKDI